VDLCDPSLRIPTFLVFGLKVVDYAYDVEGLQIVVDCPHNCCHGQMGDLLGRGVNPQTGLQPSVTKAQHIQELIFSRNGSPSLLRFLPM